MYCSIAAPKPLRLDRRTKMLLDDRHVFINGESFIASGGDAVLLKQFANARFIDSVQLTRASVGAIGRAQGRKSFGDRSNGVGRLLTGMGGAFIGRRR